MPNGVLYGCLLVVVAVLLPGCTERGGPGECCTKPADCKTGLRTFARPARLTHSRAARVNGHESATGFS